MIQTTLAEMQNRTALDYHFPDKLICCLVEGLSPVYVTYNNFTLVHSKRVDNQCQR